MSPSKITTFIVTVLISANICASDKLEFSSVQIYYYGWDVLTRNRLSLDAVRKGASVIITINDSSRSSNFYKWINTPSLNLREVASQEDPRLVIDFKTTEGKTVSFYASRFNLCTEDSKHKRPIDNSFREHFRFGESYSK